MSTQAVRNELKQNISKVIADVKQQVITEGKKRIMELKDKLLSPEYIIKILTAEISTDSCSLEGKNKFKELADKLTQILVDMEIILQKGLDIFTSLEEKIGAISSKVELPPGMPNPIKQIKTITDAIAPITKTLKYVIMAAPAILASNVSVAGVGAINGAAIANTNNGVNLAKVKIKEYVNLIRALPKILDKYISMADQVVDRIAPIKQQLAFILGEIIRLKAFIIYLEMDFLDKCNQFDLSNQANQPPTIPPTTQPPTPVVHPTLDEIKALIEELYGDMLENLIARGDHKAIRRVYTLGENFQRLINTQVKVINI